MPAVFLVADFLAVVLAGVLVLRCLRGGYAQALPRYTHWAAYWLHRLPVQTPHQLKFNKNMDEKLYVVTTLVIWPIPATTAATVLSLALILLARPLFPLIGTRIALFTDEETRGNVALILLFACFEIGQRDFYKFAGAAFQSVDELAQDRKRGPVHNVFVIIHILHLRTGVVRNIDLMNVSSAYSMTIAHTQLKYPETAHIIQKGIDKLGAY
ncbi:hypothetical protein B0H14DRAFT_3461504 [Mycena olivaceomarginata]|nr:hypothetical protein B0H14DRAFT_3461504 [Mycena olivaceomarginata]